MVRIQPGIEKIKMESLKFVSTSSVRGDCTQSYNILVQDKSIKTLKDLIDIIVYTYTNNWGMIYISFDKKINVVGRCFENNTKKINYDHDKITTGHDVLKEYANREILSVSADGGWTRYDYCVVLV